MTKTRKQPTMAAECYAARRREIDARLATLKAVLVSHARRQERIPTDWSFPGSLGKVLEILDEAIRFLDGGR